MISILCLHFGGAIVFCHNITLFEYKARRILLPQGVLQKSLVFDNHYQKQREIEISSLLNAIKLAQKLLKISLCDVT